MAYNEKLAERVREALANISDVEEQKMFRGITFMVKGKMCVSVSGDELMCRIGPDQHDAAAEQPGSREMIRGGKAIRGYIYIESDHVKTKKQLSHWVSMCLEFNSEAKATKKRK